MTECPAAPEIGGNGFVPDPAEPAVEYWELPRRSQLDEVSFAFDPVQNPNGSGERPAYEGFNIANHHRLDVVFYQRDPAKAN